MKKSLLFTTFCTAALIMACNKPEPVKPNDPDPTPTPEVVKVLSVRLDQTMLTLFEGETATIVATVIPENADNKNVSWTSDKPTIATVADGLVTAIAEGFTVITVTTEDGAKTATCNVTVKKAGPVLEMTAPSSVIIDQTYGINEDLVPLTWTAAEGASGYTISVSTSENMANAATMDLKGNSKDTLSVKEFNHLAATAGVKAGKTTTLYVQIADKEGAAIPAKATISTKTKFGSFKDPRDGEIYMTVQIGDFTWMCENLRATKYSDGEPLFEGDPADTELHSILYNEGALGDKVGVYYAFAHVVRGHYTGHWIYKVEDLTRSVQLQGICPAGWHVTAKDDWQYLFEAAAELTGEELSDDWLASTEKGTVKYADFVNKLFCAKEMTFGNMDLFSNDLGLYLTPAGRFTNPKSDNPGTTPGEYGVRAYYWSISMDPEVGIRSTMSPAITASTNKSSYYASAGYCYPTYGQSLSVRCVKNY